MRRRIGRTSKSMELILWMPPGSSVEFFLFPDVREDYGEERWIALGNIKSMAATVVFTQRGETIKIISARKATKNERQKLKTDIQDRLEATGQDEG